MHTVPGWTVITALLAPLLLIGGGAFAATHRWVMTLFILGSGLCVVLSAIGLRTVRLRDG